MKEGDIISIKINRDEDNSGIKETDLDIGIRKLDAKMKEDLISGHKNAGKPMNIKGMSGMMMSEPLLIASTKTMVVRTYATIKSFLDYATKDSTLWTSPPKPERDALAADYISFKKTIQWDKIGDGCKKFMKRESLLPLIPPVKDRISLMLYLTIAGLLQGRVAVKPYTPTDEKTTAGFVRRLVKNENEELEGYFDFEELHPYSRNFNSYKYYTYFCLTYNFTISNFNIQGKDKRKLVIHINTNIIKDYSDRHAVFTMIHEASHKFAASKDVCYFAMGFDNDKVKGIKDVIFCGNIEEYKIPLAWQSFDSQVMKKCEANGCQQDKDLAYTYNADSIAALIYHYGNLESM